MIIFSSNSMSSKGRSALRKAWTVTETSFGSVHSGKTVATIYGTRTGQHLVQYAGSEEALPDRSKHDGGYCLAEGPEPKDLPRAS